MKNLVVALLVVVLLGSFQIPTPADDLCLDACITLLQSKTGSVIKGRPFVLEFESPTEELNIKLRRTAGTAQAIVYIYVNGVRQKQMEYQTNTSSAVKSTSLQATQNKKVKLEIVNASAKDKFDYLLKVEGVTNSLGRAQVELAAQTKKTLYTQKACNETLDIKLHRTSGKAKATIYIYRGNTKIWENIWEPNQKLITKSFSNSVNKQYKLVVKNISSKERIHFSMTATQL